MWYMLVVYRILGEKYLEYFSPYFSISPPTLSAAVIFFWLWYCYSLKKITDESNFGYSASVVLKFLSLWYHVMGKSWLLTLVFSEKPDSNRPFQFWFLILFITLFLRELEHDYIYNVFIFLYLHRSGNGKKNTMNFSLISFALCEWTRLLCSYGGASCTYRAFCLC